MYRNSVSSGGEWALCIIILNLCFLCTLQSYSAIHWGRGSACCHRQFQNMVLLENPWVTLPAVDTEIHSVDTEIHSRNSHISMLE